MKKFAKISAVLAAMVLALACFAACSEDDDDGGSSQSQGGKEVVAKFASSENQTIFFYEDETFKVVEGRAASARAVFVETVVMEGTYDGNPERPGTITLTVTKYTREDCPPVIVITISGDDLSFDYTYFGTFSRLEEDFEDETFYDLTEESQRSLLVGTWVDSIDVYWVDSIDVYEEEPFDNRREDLDWPFYKYNLSGTVYHTLKGSGELVINESYTGAFYIKAGFSSIDEYKFDEPLTDDQASEVEEWIKTRDIGFEEGDEEYMEVSAERSKDRKTVKVSVKYIKDMPTLSIDELKVLNINDHQMLVGISHDYDDPYPKDDYFVYKINKDGNRLQDFYVQNWDYVDSDNKDMGIKTDEPLVCDSSYKKK